MSEKDLKSVELERIVLGAFGKLGADAQGDEAQAVVGAFCRVRPPKVEMPELETRMHCITLDHESKWKKGAVSIKPGNTRLNMRSLLSAAASGVLTVNGVVAQPWMLFFAALVLWNHIYSGLRQEITTHEAVVIWVLWSRRNNKNLVPRGNLLEGVNKELKNEGRGGMSERELDDIVNRLISLRCVERSRTDSGEFWLREWVSIKYS